MKQTVYSAWTKILAFILQQMLVVLVVINMISLYHSGYLWEYGTHYDTYTDTETFINDYINNTKKMEYYINSKIDMEEDGKYNPDKIVYFSDFLDDEYLNDEYSNTGYRLGDLVEWSNQNILFKSSARGFGVTFDQTKEFSFRKIKYDAESELYLLYEPYKNIDGLTIEEYVCGNSMYDYLPQIYDNLSKMLKTVKEEYDFYVQNSGFGENSNFYYYIENENQSIIFTNKEFDNLSKKEILDKISGCYINAIADKVNRTYSYKAKDLGYGEMQIDFNQEESYVYAVGIDTSYPYADGLYEKKLAYDDMHRRFIYTVFYILTGAFLFIYQTAVYGRKSDGTVSLSFVDKIKMEILAVLSVSVIIFILNNLKFIYEFGDMALILAGVIISSSFTMLILSISARIKAGTLWKNSILYCMGCGIIKFLKYKEITIVVLVTFCIYILANVICISMYNSRCEGIYLIMLLLINAATAVYLLKDAMSRKDIIDGIEKISGGDLDYKVDAEKMFVGNVKMAECVNKIGDGLHNAVDANMRNERLKTDLITNVSHDIKTPLTSIINYVDLIKRENIQDEKIKGYIEILDSKSQRLKHLTEDLVEASKISSGNIKLEITQINFVELVNQTDGEFSEKMKARNLEVIKTLPPTPVMINADGRRIWRVVENLYNNVAKYAMECSRVYVDVIDRDEKMQFSIKNISEQPLNIQADELTERFIRGDVSRSTEGSGLGLSIAKNLTELQNGSFEIYLDGDLFRVTITFPKA